MEFTEQMSALARVQRIFGNTAWTEDFVDHRRVGCVIDGKRIIFSAPTWQEAIEGLKEKVSTCG